jgi:hypothetical protein
MNLFLKEIFSKYKKIARLERMKTTNPDNNVATTWVMNRLSDKNSSIDFDKNLNLFLIELEHSLDIPTISFQSHVEKIDFKSLELEQTIPKTLNTQSSTDIDDDDIAYDPFSEPLLNHETQEVFNDNSDDSDEDFFDPFADTLSLNDVILKKIVLECIRNPNNFSNLYHNFLSDKPILEYLNKISFIDLEDSDQTQFLHAQIQSQKDTCILVTPILKKIIQSYFIENPIPNSEDFSLITDFLKDSSFPFDKQFLTSIFTKIKPTLIANEDYQQKIIDILKKQVLKDDWIDFDEFLPKCVNNLNKPYVTSVSDHVKLFNINHNVLAEKTDFVLNYEQIEDVIKLAEFFSNKLYPITNCSIISSTQSSSKILIESTMLVNEEKFEPI